MLTAGSSPDTLVNRRRRMLDVVLVVALAALTAGASFMAIRVFRAHGGVPAFYQNTFETAVFAACGRGFGSRGTVDPPALRTLDEFLALKTDRFDCSDLPSQLTLNRDSWKGPGLYLFALTAFIWRVTGVTWTALDRLAIAFAVATVLALYGLFRLAMGRGLAAAFASVMALSPLHLRNVPQLRDYAKAPFVLGALLVLGLLIARPRRDGVVVALAAAFGAIVGVGYGFRADLGVLLPVGVVIVMGFLHGGPIGRLGRNTVAAVALVATFGIAALPILRIRTSGGCEYHVALLGLTRPFTDALGLNPSLYEVGAQYNDALMDLEIGDYASRVLNRPAPPLCSIEYEQASSSLMFRTLAVFPADVIVRAYASVLAIITKGVVIEPAPGFAQGGTVGRIYGVLARVTTLMAPLGIWVVAVAIAGLWSVERRIGAAVFFLVLFVAGYPALQFSPRHWFHLQFIPWWAGGLLIQSIGRAAPWRNPRQTRVWSRPFFIRAGGGVLAAAVLMWGALGVVRRYQTHTVTTLVHEYQAARTERLRTERTETEAGASTVAVEWHPAEYSFGAWHRGSDMLVLTLGGAACDARSPMAVTARYRADVPAHDLTASILVPAPSGEADATHVYIPIFTLRDDQSTMLRFEQIELPRSAKGCLASVDRIVDRATPKLRLTLVAPPGWQQRRLFQTMKRFQPIPDLPKT